MMKQWMGIVLMFVVNILFASSYPGDVSYLKKPMPIVYHHALYPCNWPDNPMVHYYMKQLKKAGIQTVMYPHKLRIVIPDWVLFAPTTDRVVYTAQDPYYMVLGMAQQFPNTKITVIGYSDDSAIPEYNNRLSIEQAQKLSAYLWMNDIPNSTQTLRYEGKGEVDPIANNQRINGIADNRRIEMIIDIPS